MKLTPKHMAYGSVLALAGIALLLDSAMPPSAAAAGEAPVAPATAAVLAEAAGVYTPLDTGLAPLADRLAGLNARLGDDRELGRDVFAMVPEAWGLVEAPAELAPPPPPANPTTSMRLTAIMANVGESVAVINGRIVRVGDVLDGGFRVDQIKPRSVVLERDGSTTTLSVERR